MALLISLSLLWATVQLAFVLAPSTVYADCNWTWKLECCANNEKRFTLEIVAQTLENCSSTCSSEMCFGNYSKQSKSLDFSLSVQNGSIKLSENDTVYEKCNTQPECDPNITVNNQPLNFMQGKNECIYRTLKNPTKVKINFKCAANDNSLNLDLNKSNKSWIDALEECEKNDSSLVEISNSAVRDKVESLLQNYAGSQSGVWIGLERSIFGYNSEWKWISGFKVEDSQLNQNVSANNNFNNHCGMIVKVNNGIQWQDANCHDNLPFICQPWNKSPCTSNVTTEDSELSIDIVEESGSGSYVECN